MGEADSQQEKLLAFMGRSEAYNPPPATVERIDTHASSVFLAGPFAYKVKRAVKYRFLDFSTLEKRRLACLNELRVNARAARQLYLEVLPVTAGENGAFQIGGRREKVEWVLLMRRFEQNKLMTVWLRRAGFRWIPWGCSQRPSPDSTTQLTGC